MSKIISNKEYKTWIIELKQKVRQAQIKAAVKINTTMLEFYWELGNELIAKQKHNNWGSSFLKQVSCDMMNEFPMIKGFSETNLSYIKRWVLFYKSNENNIATACGENEKSVSPQTVTKLVKIPWGHNRVIISKCKTTKQAIFYVTNTIKYGWSRAVLTHQIESQLFEREGKAITNFDTTLPKPQSDLAKEMIKDPYKFDFLSLGQDYTERDLEDALLDEITKFLMELGAGFAFVGRQKSLQVGNREFFIDLLFYHTQMHCYIVIELKVVDFEPEFAGKLNFYLTAINKQVKAKEDKPTIGILLCRGKDKLMVEYALSDIYKPMAVSEYNLTNTLPKELIKNLPTVDDIKAKLEGEEIF